MKQILKISGALVVVALCSLAFYLLRPLSAPPEPAEFQCVAPESGTTRAFAPNPAVIYGVGLAYAKHIAETASTFDPDAAPPIFIKANRSLVRNGQDVVEPDAGQLFAALNDFEAGLGDSLRRDHPDLPALLDYETELAFVLLEDIDPAQLKREDFAPKIGFFMANDLTARSVAIMGEGQPNRPDYWGVGKSFSGLLPVADSLWIPGAFDTATLPCVQIETVVNGVVRQSESTANIIYTPRQMLRYIQAKYPDRSLRKGDMILMGTPGGVALSTSRWLGRLANLLGFDRHRKLSAVLGRDRAPFLKPGDEVEVRGTGLGSVRNRIIAAPGP